MKKFLICLLFVALVLPFTVYAQEALPQDIEKMLDKGVLNAEQFKNMNFDYLWNMIVQSIRQYFKEPVLLLVQLLGCTMLCVAATSLIAAQEWKKVTESVCVLCLIRIALSPVMQLLHDVGQAAMEWRNYLAAFVPVFSGVLISCGQPGQATIYSGMFITMAAFVAQLIIVAAIPAVQIYLAVSTASGLCETEGLKECSDLCAKAIKWCLGLLSVIFGAVLGLQSALAQTTDTLAMRTGKFLVSSGIPVIGGAASDAVGSVISGMRVVKGSLGFAAAAALTVSFVPILVRCIGCCLAYTISGIAAKALCLKKAGHILEGMSQAASICISFMAFYFLLVVLTTALMIVTGGG